MYCPDLSSYFYCQERVHLKNVIAIGWLERDQPFTTGRVSSEFLEKLRIFCFSFSILRTYGHHGCDFCNEKPIYEMYGDKKIMLGSAEILVPRDDHLYYAAPNAIFHYCYRHNYCPPIEFVDAVLKIDLESYSLHRMLEELRDIPVSLYNAIEFDIIRPESERDIEALLIKHKSRQDQENKQKNGMNEINEKRC